MEEGSPRSHIDRLHTTTLGAARIRRNLGIGGRDVVDFCRRQILRADCVIVRRGKNWYCETDAVQITVNASSFTIITAHRRA